MGPISPFEIPGMAGKLQRGPPMEVPTTKRGFKKGIRSGNVHIIFVGYVHVCRHVMYMIYDYEYLMSCTNIHLSICIYDMDG